MDLDEMLGLKGLKYEELTPIEKETYHTWQQALTQNVLTVDSIRDYIRQAKDAVEQELADTPEMERVWLFFFQPNRKAVLLKARMKNYLLLEAMLSTPEKAKQAMERAVAGIVGKN